MKTKEKEKLYCPKKQGSFRMMFGLKSECLVKWMFYYTKLNN